MESMSNEDEVIDSEALLIGEILISLNCSTISLRLQNIFKLKKVENLVDVEGKHPAIKEDESHRGVTIEPLKNVDPRM